MDCELVTWPIWVTAVAFICTFYVAWRAFVMLARAESILEAIEESVDEARGPLDER